MYLRSSVPLFCFLIAVLASSELNQPNVPNRYLTIPAIVTDTNDHAYIECWKFLSPFTKYPTIGSSLSLANTSNITYVILPPGSKEGIHKPPSPMFFVLLSGLAHVTFPFNEEELWITEGINGLVVAADVRGIGHFTEYPGEEETVALQVMFRDGVAPAHEVVGRGKCGSEVRGGSLGVERVQNDL